MEPSEHVFCAGFTKSNMASTQKGRPLKEGKLGTRGKCFPGFHGLEIKTSGRINAMR